MAAQYKTPGVYINEVDGFSSSVVQVETAVPAFIGYTEYAKRGNQSLTNVPTRITSMMDFQKLFADPASAMKGAPRPLFTYLASNVAHQPYGPPFVDASSNPMFYLYYSLMMFFNNGGSNCYVVSIGSYAGVMDGSKPMTAAAFTGAMDELVKFAEPTMLVMPDATRLSEGDWKSVSQYALQHCNMMQSRIAILDVRNGYYPPDSSPTDPISGENGGTGFTTVFGLGESFDKYGVAYYPWLNSNVTPSNSIDFSWLTSDSLATLQADLKTEATSLYPNINGQPNPKLAPYQAVIDGLTVAPAGSDPSSAAVIKQRTDHQTMLTLSPIYQQAMTDIAASVNLLPPSGGMAGVYTRNDNTFGVFHSPANTTIIGADSPAVSISDAQQENLNVPLNGLAVNAIRTFPNYGLLVWGARTMAGNSDDWRYISVRRTMIMLEQSIKYAMQSFVFQSNDALTWAAVNSTISNFLNDQWKSGALVGSKSSDAYSVAVGLGSTMTGQDILNGYLNVTVKVAVVRPAEFIVLTFQQQMQTS